MSDTRNLQGRRQIAPGASRGVPRPGLWGKPGAAPAKSSRCCVPTTASAAFLRVRLARPPATVDRPPITEKPGTVIGPYKLMQQIGEGGMGVVYMAEQQQPVRRKVALKIIKPGMDSRQVIARFEAERQALALMDHPNIAKVLDAGTTDSGRPYFVMELVKGMPIIDYCDQQQLTANERRLRQADETRQVSPRMLPRWGCLGTGKAAWRRNVGLSQGPAL